MSEILHDCSLCMHFVATHESLLSWASPRLTGLSWNFVPRMGRVYPFSVITLAYVFVDALGASEHRHAVLLNGQLVLYADRRTTGLC
jgi:hypothetical protein